jgi:signal transduction histidine kinase
MHFHHVRSFSIFDGLTDDQLGQLLAASTEVRVEPGVHLWHQGDHADDWWVLVDGAIDIIRHVGPGDSVMGRIDVPGRWAGGFGAWDENGVYLASGRGVVAGRVLRVPAEVLRDLTDAWFSLGGHLIRGVFSTVRSVESTVRQREALVRLGTLSAGLAHELNNPAAAAGRAAHALDAACQTLLSSLNRLAQDDITAAQLRALDELRREIPPALGSR